MQGVVRGGGGDVCLNSHWYRSVLCPPVLRFWYTSLGWYLGWLSGVRVSIGQKRSCNSVLCSSNTPPFSAAPTLQAVLSATNSSSAAKHSWSIWSTPTRTRMPPALPVSILNFLIELSFSPSLYLNLSSNKQLHSKNRLLTVKFFLLLLKDFLFKIGMRGNPSTVKGLSFQILSFYCQCIFFGLRMKSFVVQWKYNFEDNRKKNCMILKKF